MIRLASLLLGICFLLLDCASSADGFNKKLYRNSDPIRSYKTMVNELEDVYLVLKENNFFTYYQTLWIGITLKEGKYNGRYNQVNDTIYLNWLGTNPKTIRVDLSSKCIIGSDNLWFVDEATDKELLQLGLNK